MELFDIAGLCVQFAPRGQLLISRTRPYLAPPGAAPAFTIDLPDAFLEEKHARYPQLTKDECEYMWVGEAFYAKLLGYDGMLLHASCIEKDGRAYLFSAKSGTGKSTHTHLWMKAFEGSRIINDDKPALRKFDGKFYACGTPFSGKTDESVNARVPVRALVFLERGAENRVEPLAPEQAIPLFLSQTLRPPVRDGMARLLTLLGDLLKTVPAFRLRCNMDPGAAAAAYEGIERLCRAKEKDGRHEG